MELLTQWYYIQSIYKAVKTYSFPEPLLHSPGEVHHVRQSGVHLKGKGEEEEEEEEEVGEVVQWSALRGSDNW